jgi:hypothetical protein
MSKCREFLLFIIILSLVSLTLKIIIPNFLVGKSSAQNTEPTQTYGLNINYYDNSTGSTAWQNPNWIEGLVDSGAKWVRFESRYYSQSLYETDPSKLNLKPLEMCKLVKENGLKTLAVLDEKVSPYVIDHFSAIEDLSQWREIVKGQLAGYGKYLDALEMWNEPDLIDTETARSKNWYMDGTPEHYLDILKILFEEVQNYNQQNNGTIKVIAGALGTVRTLDPTELWDSGGFFLEGIVNLNAKFYCDYFSIHVYDGYLYPNSDTEESEGLFNVEDAYLKAQSIVGDEPIWITEVGANHAFTETAQSEFMSNVAFEPLKQTDCPLAFWYCYYNPRYETSDPDEPLHGLVNQDAELTKRDQYTTFQTFANDDAIPEFPELIILPLLVFTAIFAIVSKKRLCKPDNKQ